MTKAYYKPSKNTVTLGVLLLLFITPFVTAHLLFGMRHQLNFKTLEHGKLLSPPIQLKSLPFFKATWLKKWQLIFVGNPDTSQGPVVLSNLKQICLALGKEKHRVHYQAIPLQTATPLNTEEIILVDPDGWLIMTYPIDTNPQAVLKDIQRLLKYSHAN